MAASPRNPATIGGAERPLWLLMIGMLGAAVGVRGALGADLVIALMTGAVALGILILLLRRRGDRANSTREAMRAADEPGRRMAPKPLAELAFGALFQEDDDDVFRAALAELSDLGGDGAGDPLMRPAPWGPLPSNSLLMRRGFRGQHRA
ncbi:MAG TPA: hypothetical protein VFK32_09580 [Tepidiformaceae bacterium]|nr:hypothetical protein [Tepidiformaceae bacterium]